MSSTSSPPKTDIDLYTSGTPNGQKISITLEELGVQYTVHKIDISKNEQKEEWFLEINPNGRIPAIVDNTNGTDKKKRVFEGAAIQLYLCAKYDPSHQISFEYDSPEYWEMMEWMIWMQSGIGPMQGQANHFYRYAPEKIDYAINRYQTETKRLYSILETRLSTQQAAGKGLWVVGGKYTLADITLFSWLNWSEWAGISLSSPSSSSSSSPYPSINLWLAAINARPAVHRGLDVPEKFHLKEAMKTAKGEEEYAKYHSNWVMGGMKEDEERHK